MQTPTGDESRNMSHIDGPPVGHKNRWPSGWTIALIIGAIALLQWSSLKELYYQIAGVQVPQSTIPWHHDLDAALVDSAKSDKPVLAVFGATWCPPCKAMKRDVWPNEQVAALVESRFVPLYVDVDDRTQSSITSRYQIRSIPAVLVLDSTGSTLRRSSSMSRGQTLQFLATIEPLEN
jgi:thiol-disulfide isomerase/thioredoxin